MNSDSAIATLTAEENSTRPIVSDGRDESEMQERLDTLLDRLGIAARRYHRPDALRGGERQRVAIARALITDPAGAAWASRVAVVKKRLDPDRVPDRRLSRRPRPRRPRQAPPG